VRFFDAGQRAEGFIAIGQEAVGVIAIGQLAVGVIAIGQLARGVFVVGQLAVGVVAIGQLAIGVYGGVGMMAITGRWVKGLGFAIWPKRDDEPKLPKPISLAEVKAGQPGFVELDIVGGDHGPRLMLDGTHIDAEITLGVSDILRDALRSGHPVALVRLEQKEKLESSQDVGYREAAPKALYLEAARAVAVPKPPWLTTHFWANASLRSFGIAILAAIWGVAFFSPWWNLLFATKTTMLPSLF
jgi:hypothetical protein